MLNSLERTVPLVVDLDGTLLRTDLLIETASQFMIRHPLRAYQLGTWWMGGRCALKARLAENCEIDAAGLPYRETVVRWLRDQTQIGRRLVLATASHRLLADAVQSHLGLFDEVLATDGDVNLKSQRKRDMLVARYGERGFDYLGNAAADLPIWQVARRAYVVNASTVVERKARSFGNLGEVIEGRSSSVLAPLFRAMRPHQWIKNLLVLVPLLFAHRYADLSSVVHAVLALVVFCLLASSAYVLNDLVDVAHDRRDPKKKDRPFASGDLSLIVGWVAWPALLVVAFILGGLFLPGLLLAAMGAYFVLTLVYSLRLKQVVIIDVLTLATLYTLRIVAGAAAIRVQLSFWLLAFSVFFFLSLAFIKRFAGLKATRDAGDHGGLLGRGYVQGDLEIVSSLGVAAGYIAVLVLALYVNDSRTAELYRTPRIIWLACPVLLYWITRVWVIAHRGAMSDDPIVFAIRDRASWAVAAILLALFVLARVMP
jgi:4-hydroxybenzoate polyprenyltransferase